MIERALAPEIEHWLGRKKILILKGSRQVGKTTLLRALQKKLEKGGKKTLYLSVDQELGNPILESGKYFLKFLEDQFLKVKKTGKLYLFLDEFQYLPQSGLFLKTLFDAAGDRLQIIASGSSSLEITKNTEFLTGRKIEFYLYPLDYREFLRYKTHFNLPDGLPLKPFKAVQEFYEVYRKKIEEPFEEYTRFGGYPEVVTTRGTNDKTAILKELTRTYIEKDIIAFLRLENISGFTNLIALLCHQIGNLVNRSELSATLGLSMDTLKRYLDVLEGTYVVDFLKPRFTNVRKQISKMPKVYFNDLGLRNAVLNHLTSVSPLTGPERENFIYSELRRRYGRESIKFYRTLSKAEIDFVLGRDGREVPIEVKSMKKSGTVPKIVKSFTKDEAIVVTENWLEKQGNFYFIPIALMPFIQL